MMMSRHGLATPSVPPAAVKDSSSDPLKAAADSKTIRKRASRADLSKALAILQKAGKGNPPMPGDEWQP